MQIKRWRQEERNCREEKSVPNEAKVTSMLISCRCFAFINLRSLSYLIRTHIAKNLYVSSSGQFFCDLLSPFSQPSPHIFTQNVSAHVLLTRCRYTNPYVTFRLYWKYTISCPFFQYFSIAPIIWTSIKLARGGCRYAQCSVNKYPSLLFSI
jgi:hypothetical protein